MNMLKRFWKDEHGLELPEYAVMTALIVAAVIAAIGILSVAIQTRFETVGGVIDAASAS